MSRLKEMYKNEIMDAMTKKKFGYKKCYGSAKTRQDRNQYGCW